MVHSNIQSMCSSPELAVGEVFGVRQWSFTTERFGGKLFNQLVGHYGARWVTQDDLGGKSHRMECNSGSHGKSYTVTLQKHTILANPAEALSEAIAKQTDIFEYCIELNKRPEKLSYAYVHSSRVVGLDNLANGDAYARQVCTNTLFDTFRFWPEVGKFYPNTTRHSLVLLREHVQSIFSGGEDELTFTFNVDYGVRLPHLAPDRLNPECTCGFYAYTDVESLAIHSVAHIDAHMRWPWGAVFGIIRGFGDTVIGSHGFRTSRAEIVALTMPQLSYGSTRSLQWRPSVAIDTDSTVSVDEVRDALRAYTSSGKIYDNYYDMLADARKKYEVKGLQ